MIIRIGWSKPFKYLNARYLPFIGIFRGLTLQIPILLLIFIKPVHLLLPPFIPVILLCSLPAPSPGLHFSTTLSTLIGCLSRCDFMAGEVAPNFGISVGGVREVRVK